MGIRNVDDRLRWFLTHNPAKAGRCAEHVMNALGAPMQGFPHATSVAEAVIKAGHMQQGTPCPKGAIRYWSGGSKEGYGHVAIEEAPRLKPAAVASVDVRGPGTVGVVPLSWINNNWGNGPKGLREEGWSWWWGRINTEPERIVVATEDPKMVKTPLADPLKVKGGQWATVATLNLPPNRRYLCEMQIRAPKGVTEAGEAVLVRVGWPGLAKEDATGHNPIPPRSSVQSWRTPICHAITGGGPLDFRVWLPAGTHSIRVVAKATRLP